MILSEAELIEIRRHLHQIPELALKEFQTHIIFECFEEYDRPVFSVTGKASISVR